MITVFCNGKVHYRRIQYDDPVVKEAQELIKKGNTSYSIDWGKGCIEPSKAVCPCGKEFTMFRIDYEGFHLCPECFVDFRESIEDTSQNIYLRFVHMAERDNKCVKPTLTAQRP